jgi:hypothetical protein
MKALTCLIAFCSFSVGAQAQLAIGTIQDPFNAANAARHMPSFLGDGVRRVQVNVANASFSLGSNFVAVADAREFLRSDTYSDELIGRSIGSMHSQDNLIAASLDVSLLNVAINTGDAEAQVSFSFGLGANERAEISTAFTQAAFRFAYAGNKQFAGQFVQLAPRFDMLAFTEYYAAAACNIRSAADGWSIRPAIRVSYLAGQASVDMQQENVISVYTEPQGRYLDFDLNYRINTSLGGDSVRLEGASFNLNEKSLSGGLGNGFGMDLGLRVSPREGLNFDVALMDIGSIHFTRGVTNMYNHSTYRYEGADFDPAGEQSLSLDSIASFARAQYAHEDYAVKLPTRLALSASIGLGAPEEGSRHYYRHQLSCLYLQGFSNHLSATAIPYVGVGYTYSMRDLLHLGVNAGMGGVAGAQVGLSAAVKAGPLLLGLQSNNVLSLIAPQAGRGLDAGLLLALSF